MIPQLKTNINQVIAENSDTENKWIVYELCKRALEDYEKKNNIRFPPHRWGEYVNYIYDTLKLGETDILKGDCRYL